MYILKILAEGAERQADVAALQQRMGTIELAAPFALVWTDERLELRKLDEPALGPCMLISYMVLLLIAGSSVGGEASP